MTTSQMLKMQRNADGFKWCFRKCSLYNVNIKSLYIFIYINFIFIYINFIFDNVTFFVNRTEYIWNSPVFIWLALLCSVTPFSFAHFLTFTPRAAAAAESSCSNCKLSGASQHWKVSVGTLVLNTLDYLHIYIFFTG